MEHKIKYLEKDILWSDALPTKKTFFSYDIVKVNNLNYVICYVGTARDSEEGPWTDVEDAVMFIITDKSEKIKFAASTV